MKTLRQDEERLLDQVTAVARSAGPPILDDAEAREMVRRAALRSELAGRPHRGARGRAIRRAALAGGVLVAAAAAVVMALTHPWASAPEGAQMSTAGGAAQLERETVEPMVLALPTGDRLTVLEGSHFELVSVTENDRRVSLAEGAMVFDVAPVQDGARFEVSTHDLVVRVVGTVFGVHVGEGGTTIRVYEGRVEVVRDGEVQYLHAGEALGTGETLADDERLSAAGRRAARERSRVAVSERAAPQEAADGAADGAGVEAVSRAPASASARATEQPRLASPEPSGPTVADAWGLISSGHGEEALAMARGVLVARPHDVDFRRVEADALRALRRYGEAADAFDRMAIDGRPGERRGAGYRAAVIRRSNLGDPAGAIVSLDDAEVDSPGSPFAERGLVLRARALLALGREADARAVAERYLARYPAGTTRSFMEQLAGAVGGGET